MGDVFMNNDSTSSDSCARKRSFFAPIRSCMTCIGCLTVFLVLLSIAGAAIFSVQATRWMKESGDALTNDKDLLDGNPDAERKIAVIEIEGVIVDESDRGVFSSRKGNSKKIVRLIQKAADDESVCAILVSLNTPGGGVAASDEIHHALSACGKPVVAMMNSMAASGGYYVAAAAKKIVAAPTTLTGSIGVVLRTYGVSKLLTAIQVEPLVLTSGSQKAMLDPTLPVDAESVKLAQTIVDEMYRRFARIVSASRGIPLEKVLAAPIGDGRILTGEQAFALQLVDRIGYFSDAVDEAMALAGTSRRNCKVVRWTDSNPMQEFFSSFSAGSGTVDLRIQGLGDAPTSMIAPGKPCYLPAFF